MMKSKVFSAYSKLISLCMLLLGFNSCDGLNPGTEYGVPSAKYKVSGKVVSSETKKPVPRIRVVMIPDISPSPTYIEGDTVFTDAEGKFEVNRHNFPYNKFNIKLQDIDGEVNGEFEEKSQPIEFKNSDYKNGDNWYQGQAEKDLGTVEITPKPNQPEI